MISQAQQDTLEDIAFSESAKASNRILALSALAGTSTPLDKILATLEDISADPKTSDGNKVKAIILYKKLSITSEDEELLSAVEAENLKQELLENFTGGQQASTSPRQTQEQTDIQET